MLRLEIKTSEGFDEQTQEFVLPEVIVLELEHSLASLSKWESRWNIPFLNGKHNEEQTLDYIRSMNLRGDFPENVFSFLTEEHYETIRQYIEKKMTATTLTDTGKKRPSRVITAELIYYWMTSHNIPFECQYWHLDRLLTLIQLCNAENAAASGKKPAHKPSMTSDVLAQRRELNEKRRRDLGSTGLCPGSYGTLLGRSFIRPESTGECFTRALGLPHGQAWLA